MSIQQQSCVEAMKQALAEAQMLVMPVPAKEVTALDIAKAVSERALKLCTLLEQAVARAEGTLEAEPSATPREPLTDEQIDYSIKKNDIVTSKSWSLTELIVVDVNWALGAVAVQLGYGGGIVVWPALSLKKEAAHNQRN